MFNTHQTYPENQMPKMRLRELVDTIEDIFLLRELSQAIRTGLVEFEVLV